MSTKTPKTVKANFDKAKDVLPSKISKSASNLSCLGNLLFFKAKDNSLSFLSDSF